MDKKLLDDRIDDLCDNFHSYVNLTLNTYKLDTPARYFHIKTIKRLTVHQNMNAVLDDSLFFDYLYATLVSWGMESRSAILCGFDEFKNSILEKRNEIIELNKYSIKNLVQEDEERYIDSYCYSEQDIQNARNRLDSLLNELGF